jgi:hypothetical protein
MDQDFCRSVRKQNPGNSHTSLPGYPHFTEKTSAVFIRQKYHEVSGKKKAQKITVPDLLRIDRVDQEHARTLMWQ